MSFYLTVSQGISGRRKSRSNELEWRRVWSVQVQGGEQFGWQDVIIYALELRSPWCLSASVQED